MVHIAPDRRHRKRGRGPAGVLAALGTSVVVTAVPLLVIDPPDAEGGPDGGRARRAAAPAAVLPPERGPSTAAPAPAAAPLRRAAAAGRPVRVEIPSLDVAATVLSVELDGRALVPPDDPRLLGWWSGGAVPGAARGTAVIAGHTVHSGGGALDDLGRLRRGDLLRVATAKGVLDYRVRATRVYARSSLGSHAEELFAQDVAGRLAVVTCADWNGRAYESNVVVLAIPQ